MSILRSEDMNLLKLVMSKDQEYAIMDRLGQLEIAHFIDINVEEEVFTLPYMEMLRRCEETERRLLAILAQCKEHDIPLVKVTTVEELTEMTDGFAEEYNRVSSHN